MSTLAATYPSLLVDMVTGNDHLHQMRRYFMYGLVVHTRKMLDQAFDQIHPQPPENTAPTQGPPAGGLIWISHQLENAWSLCTCHCLFPSLRILCQVEQILA